MSVWLFARHELVALGRDRRAWATALCLFVLLGAALVSGGQVRRAYEQTRANAQAASHRQWLGQGTKNPHSAAHFGVYAFRPLPALAPFEPGLHAVLGTTVYLEAHNANDLRDAPEEDGSRLAELDGSAGYLSRTALPLLVFFLVAASIVGERERGTLKLLLAQGGSFQALVLGKLLAFGVLLSGLVLGATLSASLLAPAEWARVLGLAAGYGLLVLLALFVATAVSIAAKDSRRAVAVLVLLWAVGALIGPRIAASVASSAVPMPLRAEARGALERALDAAGYQRRTETLKERVLAQHGVKRVEDLPLDFRGLALQHDEERGAVIFDQHRARLRERERAQDAWLHGASLLFPWLALEAWSTAFAGTDLLHAEHFADAAERYRRELVGRMNRAILDARGADGDLALWSTMPAFEYRPPAARFAFTHAWPSSLVLTFWSAASLVAVLRLSRAKREIGAGE